jgi:hypothetical protein
MTKAEFEALKGRILEHREKSADMDIIVAQLMKLPYGQLKKVLTDEVLAVLAKYGYGEE